MNVGLMAPTLFNPEPCDMNQLRMAAEIADQSGFEVLWVGDHLLWHVPILDAMTALGALSALTHRTSIGTNVLQLPLRRPLDVAKSFASLSYLTGGRVVLGVGVGGEYEPEWDAAGVNPRVRGRRCDEALQALEWYWNGDTARESTFMSPGVAIEPSGRVPIWIGGRSEAAIRRAARYDGYLGVWLGTGRVKAVRELLERERGDLDGFRFGLQVFTRVDEDADNAREIAADALRRTYGIDPAPLKRYIAAGTPEQIAEVCLDYAALGVDHISFYIVGPDWADQATRVASEVLPLLGMQRGISPLDPRKC